MKLIMNGAGGRMGQAILACAQLDPDVQVVGRVDLGDSLETVIENGDAVIDFTHACVTPGVAAMCVEHKKALVIGTTGHTDDERAAIVSAAEKIPVVFAPNFSVGVNTLFWLTQKAAEILGTDFDLEVVEMHHRLKKDAPSGTARRLAEILAEVRSLEYAEAGRHGREGMVGQRTAFEIGIHAVRGGDVVGDHTVIFATNGERVELTHKASSRDTFAVGAIRAAKWAMSPQRAPGLYDMQDVLGLR